MKLFFKKVNKSNQGFTLVETLVAISIFSMSIVALMSILGGGISNTGYAKQKIIASYLAQEGIESIRNMRDSYVLYSTISSKDWDKFKVELNSCNQGGNKECGFDNSVLSTNSNFIFKCPGDQCKLYINNGNYNTNLSGVDSGFVRKIWMDAVGADEFKISSYVEWTQKSGTYSITFSENLFNWVEL